MKWSLLAALGLVVLCQARHHHHMGPGGDERQIIDHGGIKPGSCPVVEEGAFGICGGIPCQGDDDCPGDDKCCERPCGRLCIAPVREGPGGDERQIIDHGGLKPGSCPVVEEGAFGICGGIPCQGDGDCPGDDKCCERPCGRLCIAPVREAPPAPVYHPGVCPMEVGGAPYCTGNTCSSDGDCAGFEKCCDGCGQESRCMPAPQIQPPVIPEPVEHPGNCPRLGPIELGNCDGQECRDDSSCFENEKCCRSACGYHCTPALQIDPPAPVCEGDLVFNEHGPVCEETCTEGRPTDCIDISLPGCSCPEGTIRVVSGSTVCVPREQCPQDQPTEQQCPDGLLFNRCGTRCQLTCEFPEPRPCIRLCARGCFCPEGMIRESEESNNCFPDVALCPAKVPTPLEETCEGDLVFDRCGTACELTCEKPEPRACTRQCVPGCFCPDNLMRVSAGNNTCVEQSECPAPDPHQRPCEEERSKKLANSSRAVGVFVPQCTQDGMYAAKQCHSSTGYCWCANVVTGAVIEGTETQILEPNCEVPVSTPPPPASPEPGCSGDLVPSECASACDAYCNQPEGIMCATVCSQGCTCPEGTVKLTADSDRCVPAEECPDPEPVQICSEGYKLDVDNTCVVEKPCPVYLAEANEGGILPGEFVPECTTEGLYTDVQCHSSTGYCWCVDVKTGVKFAGSDIRFRRPDCSVINIEPPNPEVLNVCPEGTEFAVGVKKCVPVPTPPPPPVSGCSGDLVPSECASPCDAYCNQPEGILCATVCFQGCTCPEGTVKMAADSDRCVPAEECPGAEQTCPDGQEFSTCGSSCPAYCGQPEVICTQQCVQGCFCPEGHVLLDEESQACIAPEDCPQTEPECEGDLVYTECGTACPSVCNQEAAEVCIAMCVTGCACPDGLYLETEGGNTCVAQEECPELPFTCPERLGTCPDLSYQEFECTEQCSDDYDCAGERKCCSHSCGSVCYYPYFPVPQPYPQLFPPPPTSPPAEGITVETCPASDVAVENCEAACESAADCGEGETCCENDACQTGVCLAPITEQRCTTVPCPVFDDSTPIDLEKKVCGSDYIFIVKIRGDGRGKILDDLKFNSNPYTRSRPIVNLDMDAQCSTIFEADQRYFILSSGPKVNLQDKDKSIVMDHTALVMPMTGHRKNEIKEVKDFCPIA